MWQLVTDILLTRIPTPSLGGDYFPPGFVVCEQRDPKDEILRMLLAQCRQICALLLLFNSLLIEASKKLELELCQSVGWPAGRWRRRLGADKQV